MPPSHVFVTVPEGRIVPVPPAEAHAGGMLLKCEAGKVYRVPWSTYTRRRIIGGDFILATIDGRLVFTPEAADATTAKTGPDGAVADDQRTDQEINDSAAADTRPTVATSTIDLKGKA